MNFFCPRASFFSCSVLCATHVQQTPPAQLEQLWRPCSEILDIDTLGKKVEGEEKVSIWEASFIAAFLLHFLCTLNIYDLHTTSIKPFWCTSPPPPMLDPLHYTYGDMVILEKGARETARYFSFSSDSYAMVCHMPLAMANFT